MTPSREFRDRIRDCLMSVETGEDERYFVPEELLEAEKTMRHGDARGKHDMVFDREGKKKWKLLFSDSDNTRPVPEGYIRHFFVRFDALRFIHGDVGFSISGKKEFTAGEVLDAIEALSSHVFLRDPGSLVQSSIPTLKALAIAVVIIWYAVPLSIDLGLLFYGFSKNDYYWGTLGASSAIRSVDSPFSRRARRIHRMNSGFRKDSFSVRGMTPVTYRPVKISPKYKCAVELSYSRYKYMRTQDQNGCTILAINENRLKSLGKAQRRYFLDSVLEKTLLEKLQSTIDGILGTSLLTYDTVSGERLRESIASGIHKAPSPLNWLKSVDRNRGIVSVIYHKPNTMKWCSLEEVPPLMIESLILLEDRRFRNDFFPLPHRGNDHMVILPQIWRKVAEGYLGWLKRAGSALDLPILKKWSEVSARSIRYAFRGKERGGSSLSNQLMELLYTKFIVTISGEKEFNDRQVDQKKFELPASAMLDWFWTENEILEAYVNEVYGGHLYSDVRGLKSEAEIFFQKNLADLSLREQVLLIAAIKKPSLIKEYAQWGKALELSDLIVKANATPAEVRLWEERNERYGVTERNYRATLDEKNAIGHWIDRRMKAILGFLLARGRIDREMYHLALRKDTLRFNYNPGLFIDDPRLTNAIRREIENELGPDRSDSGAVLFTTIDPDAQGSLQSIINGASRRIFVEGEDRVEGQPPNITVGGGGRIIRAHRESRDGTITVVNQIIADCGGSTPPADEWDWVSQANRSLGSSLKPLLDLYFILMGYNLNDSFRNGKITYNTYTLEQRRIYEDYILKHPSQKKDIDEIEKNWLWTPKNYQYMDDEWISVREALVRSVNGIHVQIQELVTPAAFAEMLNDTMNITRPEERHKPYRSIILGGSSGDQRYDRYLLAYSIIPNFGLWQKHTFIDVLRLPDGTILRPSYKSSIPRTLSRFTPGKVSAACLVISQALREIVKRGTMRGMDGIGAGKTGTSNEMRDALATVHFKSGDSVYIAGIRLGNAENFSLGRAADRFAVPVLRDMVKRAFEGGTFGAMADFDEYLASRMSRYGDIVRVDGELYLRGAEYRPRRLNVARIQEQLKRRYKDEAEAAYQREDYEDAAKFYEEYLLLTEKFSPDSKEFENMVNSYIRIKDLGRAQEIIEHFSPPGRILHVAARFEKANDVKLKVDRNFYAVGATMAKERPQNDKMSKTMKNGKKSKTAQVSRRKQRLIDYAKEFVEKLERHEEAPRSGN